MTEIIEASLFVGKENLGLAMNRLCQLIRLGSVNIGPW